MSPSEAMCLIGVSGAFGGIISYLIFHAYDDAGRFKEIIRLQIPSLIAHGLIGIAGAIAIQIIILAMRFYESLGDADPNKVLSSRIFLIAMSLIGGYSARAFLTKISSSIEKKIDEIDSKTDRALAKATEAGKQSDEIAEQTKLSNMVTQNAPPKDIDYVIGICNAKIKENPSKPGGYYILKARAQRAKCDLLGAINTLEQYIHHRGTVDSKDRAMHTAHYNLACYSNLLFRSSQDSTSRTTAIVNLKLALKYSVRLDDDMLYAKHDPDISDLASETEIVDYVEDIKKDPK